MKSRIGDADKDHDGKMTVAEIAAEIERMRAERMARRIVERFDTDGDGMLTAAEIESRQKKMFALLDRNDDGKIVKDEMPRRGKFAALTRLRCAKSDRWLARRRPRPQAATPPQAASAPCRDRDAHRHDGADAFGRSDLQRAAMQLGQRARDGEAEARAGMALGELVLHLLERPAELAELVLGDAAPLSSMVSTMALATLRALTEMWPPWPVNFTALDSRLMAICLIARRSANSDMFSEISVSTVIDFLAACSEIDPHRLADQRPSSISSRSMLNWPASIFDMSSMSLMTPSR